MPSAINWEGLSYHLHQILQNKVGEPSGKEKIHHIEYPFGSLMEAYCQLQIGMDLEYVTVEELFSVKDQFI